MINKINDEEMFGYEFELIQNLMILFYFEFLVDKVK